MSTRSRLRQARRCFNVSLRPPDFPDKTRQTFRTPQLQLERSPSLAVRSPDGLRLDLARALESLSAPHREVILMRDFEELTIGEMAARLALTREATKSRLHRARLLIREYLTTGEHADAPPIA